jgi:hypothetical protein
MGEHDWFFKFMRELGTSGVWGRLSAAAKAVYPMLGIHTDGSFKPVYPSILRLMELTGLSKNGVLTGLRNLQHNGLIIRRSGRSHKHGEANRNNIYEFAFSYPGSTLAHGVRKPLRTEETSPLSSPVTSPGLARAPEQESDQPEQQQQQQHAIHLNLTLRQDESIAAAALDLLRRYFDENAAQRLAAQYPPDYIQKKVTLVEQRARGNRLRNKPGYLRRALEDGWSPSSSDQAAQQFDDLLASIRAGRVREALVGEVPWRAGVTADQRAIYLTHMPTGAQMRFDSWDDCAGLEWH